MRLGLGLRVRRREIRCRRNRWEDIVGRGSSWRVEMDLVTEVYLSVLGFSEFQMSV